MRSGMIVLGLVVLAAAPGGARATGTADLEPFRGQTITAIELAGNRVTRDYVIAREIWSEVGQPLDPALVADDITRLENLAIFGSVIVTPEPRTTATTATTGITLDFEFTEMPSLIPFPAVTWNEQNGFSGGLGLASPNFLGHGVSLSTKAVFGGTTNVYFRASNPWIAGDHFSVELLAYHFERENTLLEFDQRSDRVEATLGYYLGPHGRLSGNLAWWGMHSDVEGITLDPDGQDNLLLLGTKIGYDNRDSWRVPHSGWQAELGTGWLAGDANSTSVTLDLCRYQPVARRHTLAVGPLLSLQSGDVGTDIPTYNQYFLGGSSNVRGYHLNDLGQEIQGRNQLIFNLEYRWLALPVRPLRLLRWSVAVGVELAAFGDVGTIWNDPSAFSLDRTRAGYGAGVRFLLPGVEMIRFDLGVSEFGDVVFNFGVQSMFEARSLPAS